MVTLPKKGPVNLEKEAKELKEMGDKIKQALGSGKSRAELEAELKEMTEQTEVYKKAEEQWNSDKADLESDIAAYKAKEPAYKAAEAENKKLGKKVGELEGKASELEGKVEELEGKASELKGDLEICGQNTDAYKALYQAAKDIIKYVADNL